MNTEIKHGSRVRVAVHRGGYHKRNFFGKFMNWTPKGQARVLEDGCTKAKAYPADDVKLIKQ